MAKRLTCAKWLDMMYRETPGYPPIMPLRGTGRDACFFLEKDDTWTLCVFRFHGYAFIKVAKGLSAVTVAMLIDYNSRA